MLFLDVAYDTGDGRFSVDTNIKDERAPEIIGEFLRSQLGEGADKRPPTDERVVHIRLDVDLSDDSFRVTHDCGNLSLRDGILLDVMKRYGAQEPTVIDVLPPPTM